MKIIITDNNIEHVYNKECVFCLEDINENKENINKNQDIKVRLNISKIILQCNHNYHFGCFFMYITSKLITQDDYIILKYKTVKCPICRSKMNYWELYTLVLDYIYILNNDVKTINKCINKKYVNRNCKKVEFFIKNILNKNIYLKEICDYYKNKKQINELKQKKQELLSFIYILKNIRIR